MLNKSVFNYNPVVVRDKIMNIICDVVPFSVACSPEQNFLIAFMIGHRSLSLSLCLTTADLGLFLMT